MMKHAPEWVRTSDPMKRGVGWKRHGNSLSTATISSVGDTVSCVDDTVSCVDESVSCVDDTVSCVDDTVSCVDDTVSCVDDTVSCVDDTVSCVDDTVSCVDDTVSSVDDTVSCVVAGCKSQPTTTHVDSCCLEIDQQQQQDLLCVLSPVDHRRPPGKPQSTINLYSPDWINYKLNHLLTMYS